MRLLTRAFLNELINEQNNTNIQLNQRTIFKKYGIKPYKREGKSLLYKLDDIHSIGIRYDDNLDGYYPIKKFKDKFWINKEGEVINITNGNKRVKTYIGTDMYEHITLMYYGKKYRFRVHSLMGKVFLGNPPVVNHEDGVKSNNKLSNLKRSTHSENIKHAYKHDYYTSRGGTGTPVLVKSKDTKEEFLFTSLRKAEKHTGVDRHRIKRIIQGDNVNNTKWDFEFK